MSEFLFILGVGKLVIFLVQQFPYTKNIHWKFWNKLFNCGLCLGFYVYFSLVSFYHFDLISKIGMPRIPLVNEILTSAIISYFVHLMSLGFKLQHGLPFEDVK